ncbi:MAG: FAD-dependent oxidoreductase [Chloroflexota bacterium]
MEKLTRRDFIRLSSLLGLSTALSGCAASAGSSFEGKVIVIGAGAAGMSAAYLLKQQGIDVEVLEANSVHGGRVRVNKTFTDFPISLGGEWLHANISTLDSIVNDNSVEIGVEMAGYDSSNTRGYYQDGVYSTEPSVGDNDTKFVGSSWFDFYEQYIVPSIQDKMRYGVEITDIDYSNTQVQLTDKAGNSYAADRVIITIPLKILQDGDVSFSPRLPFMKRRAIESAVVWSGFKAFFEFTEQFFPAVITFPDTSTDVQHWLFYDASHGQNTDRPILGLFSVGAKAEAYQAMSDEEFQATILGTLDEIFDGAASRTYVKHMTQNWNEEPFARAAYLQNDSPFWVSREMARSIDSKLYFAGSAYTSFGTWSSVHAAARSARVAADEITGLA